MSDKPSYLGLLNAIALGETAAHEYLEVWAAATPRDDVRGVLQTVSAREGEHGKAFAKRINELGYTLKPKDNPKQAEQLALAARTDLTDLEKMERFGFGRSESGDGTTDVFDSFFTDHSIDIRTGELLGRYIAEERDSGRLLRTCYQQLKAESQPRTIATPASDDRLAALESKLDSVCSAVDQLCEVVTAQVGATTTANGG